MYQVRLEDFEGPLDLLLFFIRRDELDIYDIPVASITDEFLGYVRLMDEIDLDGVAEFIYMAALLISIKAKMLLPRQELDEDGEPIDPRQELVERLLEYMRFKEAALELTSLEEERGLLFTRGEGATATWEEGFSAEEVFVNTTIFDLVGALRRVLSEAPEEPIHAIERTEYSIEDQKTYVVLCLSDHKNMLFRKMVGGQTRPFIIATFLAILELAKLGRVWLKKSPNGLDFVIQPLAPSADNGLPIPHESNGQE